MILGFTAEASLYTYAYQAKKPSLNIHVKEQLQLSAFVL